MGEMPLKLVLRSVIRMCVKAYRYIELARASGRWDILDRMIRGEIPPREALRKLESIAREQGRTINRGRR